MATGTAVLDFGAFPGKLDTSVAVTGQAAIVAGSLVEAWIRPIATAAHSIDEHILATTFLKVVAAAIIAGTGFTIYGLADFSNSYGINVNPGWREFPGKHQKLYGTFTVAWAWV